MHLIRNTQSSNLSVIRGEKDSLMKFEKELLMQVTSVLTVIRGGQYKSGKRISLE